MEIGANQMMHLALMLAVLPCHLNVMKIVRYVTWVGLEVAGWEIIANLGMYLAQ